MRTPASVWMEKAIRLAAKAGNAGEVPVAALIVCQHRILALSANRVERDLDPTAHAELVVIRRAAKRLGQKKLVGCDLYVTLEPCPMCAQAISFARLRRLYFAAYDPKGGGVEHGPRIFLSGSSFHQPEIIGGLCERQSSTLLKQFFQKRRIDDARFNQGRTH